MPPSRVASHHSFGLPRELLQTTTIENLSCTASNVKVHLCGAVSGLATQCGAGSDNMAGERGASPEAPGGCHHEALQQAGPPEDRHPPAAPLGGSGGRPCLAHHHPRQRACQQTGGNGVWKLHRPHLALAPNRGHRVPSMLLLCDFSFCSLSSKTRLEPL